MNPKRWLRWCIWMAGLLAAVSQAVPGQASGARQVLTLELMGTDPMTSEAVPLAHFFIEPESGAWGAAGSWAAWQPEGGWYFRQDEKAIYRVRLLTGETQPLTHNLPSDAKIRHVALSPDGQWIAFLTIDSKRLMVVYAVHSDGTEQRVLMHGDITDRVWEFGWSADGQSVEFLTESQWYAYTQFSVRLDGFTRITEDPGGYWYTWYRVSPDGKWMAWHVEAYAYDSYVKRLDSGAVRPLADGSLLWKQPLWSPDSQWLYYVVETDGVQRLYRERPDGSARVAITPQPEFYEGFWISPDGKWLYVLGTHKVLYRAATDRISAGLQRLAELPGYMDDSVWAPARVAGGPWLYFTTAGNSNGHGGGKIYRLQSDSGQIQDLGTCSAHYIRQFWSPETMPGELWLYFMSDCDSTQADRYALFRMHQDGSDFQRLTDYLLDPNGGHFSWYTGFAWSVDNVDNRWLLFNLGSPNNKRNCRMRPDGSDPVCLPGTYDGSLTFDSLTPLAGGQWAGVVIGEEQPGQRNLFGVRQDGTGGLINLTGRTDQSDYRNLIPAPANIPGGPWLYFESNLSGDWELYRLQPNTRQLENLTHNPAEDTFGDLPADRVLAGIWSPDGVAGGPWLYFVSKRDNGLNLYRMQPDGSQVEQLTHFSEPQLHVEWSPDARWLIFWPSDWWNPVDGFRMRPDGSDVQPTQWIFTPPAPGNISLRREISLDNERWILEQEVDLAHCDSWIVRLRAATDSSTVRATIPVGPYVPHDDPCVAIGTRLTIGSRYLDGITPTGAPVLWLPMMGTDR